MIQLTGAGKRYGPRILFENTDWLVTPQERAGIVGANGTGKSSLLKVLAGIEGLDSGTITTQKGVTIGYLPQEGLSLSGRSVFADCMTVFEHLDLEARNWLEEYLSAYPYAFVLVSHDRYFLDVTVRKIIELWNKALHFYSGGYSRYEVLKTERRAQLLAAYANQKERIDQLEA